MKKVPIIKIIKLIKAIKNNLKILFSDTSFVYISGGFKAGILESIKDIAKTITR